MTINDFYDNATGTMTYLVYDAESGEGVIIDPVLDYEPYASKISYNSAKTLLTKVRDLDLDIKYILETHVHADHMTSAQFLKENLPETQTAIHKNITIVQRTFKEIFNYGEWFETEGASFDRLLDDGDKFTVGNMEIQVIHTPGHTPACVSYLINQKSLFVGDALFMPDFGTGRCDFPEGSVEALYHSVHSKLYQLSDDVEIYVGHDYQPGGRELRFKTTIGEQKASNVQLRAETTKAEFIKFREDRDSKLPAPRLLLPSIQINAQNGKFPPQEDNGTSYLKVPLRIVNPL